MNKLMMKLTIGSEAILFLSLIVAYLYFWRSGHFQSMAANHLSVRTTGIFSVFLFSSSFTFWRAEKNHQYGKYGRMNIWLAATILLGLVFLAGQGHEYYKLIHENITISQNEFGSSFYTLTGFHGLHVAIGLIVLSTVLLLSLKGFFNQPQSSVIGTVGIYWHFVDAVWLVVFTVIYVLPYLL